MASDTLPVPELASARAAAYSTARPDIAELVPATALAVLDVGCFSGALGAVLMEMAPQRKVSGIELDADAARHARTRLADVLTADLNTLDWQAAFGARRFDCIVFADVLEHLVQPQACLQAALRQLAPGGSIVLGLPNIRHLSALTAIFIRGRFPRRARGIFDATHLRWFTIADAHALLEENGLRVVASRQALRWGDQGGGRINRLLNRLPPWLQRWGPVRELLTYQICLRAQLPS